MYWGKYASIFFPDKNWGSHFVINREAYKLLLKKAQKLKLSLNNFPTLKQIAAFEGLNGPDGLVLEGKFNSSTMYYNPVNGQGEAPQGIKNNFLLLKKILSKKNNKINRLRAARRAAFLSHLIADSLNPAHHFGRYTNLKIRFYWKLFKSDWLEEGISGIAKGMSLEHQHVKFEKSMLYKLRNCQLIGTKIFDDFINDYQLNRNINPFYIQNRVIKEIEKVYQYKIYQNFITNDWTNKIQNLIVEKVMIQAISWTATYWCLALIESQQVDKL